MSSTQNDIDKLFPKAEPISVEQLVRYAQGDLNHKEQHKIEKYVLENPFEADALEGLLIMENPALAKEYSKKIEEAFQQTKQRRLIVWLPVAASVAILISIGLFFLKQPESLKEEGMITDRFSVKIEESVTEELEPEVLQIDSLEDIIAYSENEMTPESSRRSIEEIAENDLKKEIIIYEEVEVSEFSGMETFSSAEDEVVSGPKMLETEIEKKLDKQLQDSLIATMIAFVDYGTGDFNIIPETSIIAQESRNKVSVGQRTKPKKRKKSKDKVTSAPSISLEENEMDERQSLFIDLPTLVRSNPDSVLSLLDVEEDEPNIALIEWYKAAAYLQKKEINLAITSLEKVKAELPSSKLAKKATEILAILEF